MFRPRIRHSAKKKRRQNNIERRIKFIISARRYQADGEKGYRSCRAIGAFSFTATVIAYAYIVARDIVEFRRKPANPDVTYESALSNASSRFSIPFLSIPRTILNSWYGFSNVE